MTTLWSNVDIAVFQTTNEFGGLVFPGGQGPENIRRDQNVQRFVREFADLDRPIKLLRQWRDCDDPELKDACFQDLLLTINAIASGLRTTG